MSDSHQPYTEDQKAMIEKFNANIREGPSSFAAPSGSVDYKHKWEITIEADSPRGAMDAVWHCWEAWRDGNEPIGMSCPASMGYRVSSRVKKVH